MNYLNFFIYVFSFFSLNTENILSKPSIKSKKVINQKLPVFDIEGHRGCRGLMPENTVSAMLKALDLGVTTLEMDICFSKDKQVLLSHEPFFNHEITTKPDGTFITENEERNYNLYQMSFDSIQKYDAGLKPHPRFTKQEKINVSKPLLSDVFIAVRKYMDSSNRAYPFFNIETKTSPETDSIYHPAPAEFVDRLMAVIKEYKMENQVIIQSFDVRTLQYLHKNYPTIKTALLIEEKTIFTINDQLKTLGFVPTIYSPAFSLVNKNMITFCHKKHIKVIPWTVNSLEEIIRLKKLGVDGIITDYPDLLNKLKLK